MVYTIQSRQCPLFLRLLLEFVLASRNESETIVESGQTPALENMLKVGIKSMNVTQNINKLDNYRNKKMLSWLLTAMATPITSLTLRSSVPLKNLRKNGNTDTGTDC